MIFLLKLLASLFLLGVVVWWINRGVRAKRKVVRLVAKAAKAFERDRSELVKAFNAMQQAKQAGSSMEKQGDTLLLEELPDEQPVFASDLYAGELYALAAARLATEKETTAESQGTVIYRWTEDRGGQWLPTGRLLLGATPDAAMEQYQKKLVKL